MDLDDNYYSNKDDNKNYIKIDYDYYLKTMDYIECIAFR